MPAIPSPRSPRARVCSLARLAAVGATLVAVTVAGTAPVHGTTTDDRRTDRSETWPGDDWKTVSPRKAGFDPEQLAVMAANAERAGSQCLVVTRDGKIVGEWYWQGFTPTTEREVFSATKSIASTLVGIAQDQGLLDIDQPASDFITEWKSTPSNAVTIRNLLSNDSGRYQTFESDYAQLPRSADKTAFAIGLDQQHPVGSTWVYNNAAIQTLDAVISRASGMPTSEFAERHLFEPLGMSSHLTEDAAGNALTFMGAQASCRDLARFGLLIERGGEWDGRQIVSSAWVEEATSPSQSLFPAYGYLWWLNTNKVWGPNTPLEMHLALGLNNQIVAILPESDVVVTRLGAAGGEDGSSFGPGDVGLGVCAAIGTCRK